jgi:hypothetical protein
VPEIQTNKNTQQLAVKPSTYKSKKKEREFTIPTMKHPRCEDETEWINVQQFKNECKKCSREIIYAGTDYGVVTMSTTVSMTDD